MPKMRAMQVSSPNGSIELVEKEGYSMPFPNQRLWHNAL